MGVRERLATLGLTLPAVPQMPPGVVTTFSRPAPPSGSQRYR